MRQLLRAAAPRLERLLRGFPAVLIVGPRQCGKSTLARTIRPGWTKVDLERPSDARRIAADVEAFLESHPRDLVIDEAQRIPELFPALRHFLDRPGPKGRVILTGSATPAIMREVSESLAGRIGILELTPLRAIELEGEPEEASRWFWGGFPPVLAADDEAIRVAWLDAYVSTALERDLPALGWNLPAARVRTLLTSLTYVNGNLLNVSDLARTVGVDQTTINRWLDVLEGMFFVRRLRPHFANVSKRLVKAPKLYYRDTGLLHALSDLRRPEELDAWPRRGASFEALVIEELVSLAADRDPRTPAAFWRTATGVEVDLLLGTGKRMLPVEIKCGSASDPRSFASLKSCMQDLELKRGWIVAAAGERRDLGGGIEVIPWSDLAAGRVELPD